MFRMFLLKPQWIEELLRGGRVGEKKVIQWRRLVIEI